MKTLVKKNSKQVKTIWNSIMMQRIIMSSKKRWRLSMKVIRAKKDRTTRKWKKLRVMQTTNKSI